MYGVSKKWWVYWTLSVSLLCGASSYGQTPTPSELANKPKHKNAAPNKNAPPDQRGTEQSPLVVKILPSPSSDIPTNDTANEKHNDAPQGWWNREEWWSEHIVEIILAVATVLLWIATRDLVRGAEKTAERQLRAYIGIKEGHMAIKDGNKLSGIIVMKNSGQTPAYNVKAWCITGVFEPNEPISFRQAETKVMYGDIGCKGSIHLTISSKVYPPEKIASIKSKTHPTFAWGRVTYRDVFMKDWETEFRVTMGNEVGTDRWGLRPCEEGNKST